MSVASLLDAGDLENRQLLTVALALVVTGFVLELVDTNLGALGVLKHLTGHRDLGKRGGIGSHGGTVDDQCNRQRHLGAGVGVELLDLDDVSDRDFVLLAAGLDDCVGRHGYVYLFFLALRVLAGAALPTVRDGSWSAGQNPVSGPGDNWSRVRDQRLKGQTGRSVLMDRWAGRPGRGPTPARLRGGRGDGGDSGFAVGVVVGVIAVEVVSRSRSSSSLSSSSSSSSSSSLSSSSRSSS